MANMFFDPLYHGCMHMSSMCAHGETQTHTTYGSVCTLRISSPNFISGYSPSSVLSFDVFCPTLGVPPVVCHAKIAQLLLDWAKLNSAVHCVMMGGRGMNRP